MVHETRVGAMNRRNFLQVLLATPLVKFFSGFKRKPVSYSIKIPKIDDYWHSVSINYDSAGNVTDYYLDGKKIIDITSRDFLPNIALPL